MAFGEALRDDFKEYQRQVLANAKALSSELQAQGLRIVSGGTDNHLMLVDVWMDGKGITGKDAEKALEAAHITVNKNTIPFDQNKPFVASGLAHRHPGSNHARHERTRDAGNWPLDSIYCARAGIR